MNCSLFNSKHSEKTTFKTIMELQMERITKKKPTNAERTNDDYTCSVFRAKSQNSFSLFLSPLCKTFLFRTYKIINLIANPRNARELSRCQCSSSYSSSDLCFVLYSTNNCRLPISFFFSFTLFSNCIYTLSHTHTHT